MKTIIFLFVAFITLQGVGAQSTQDLMKRADAAEAAGRWDAALEALNQIQKITPKDPWIAWRLGHHWDTFRKDLTQARIWYEEAVTRRPEASGMYFHWFNVLDQLDDFPSLERAWALFEATFTPSALPKGQNREFLESVGRYARLLFARDRVEESGRIWDWAEPAFTAGGTWWYAHTVHETFQVLGHKAFAQGLTREAKKHYARALAVRTRCPEFAPGLSVDELPDLIEAVGLWERRQSVPELIHTISAVTLARTDVDQVYTDGVRRSGKFSVTPALESRARLYEELLSRLVEAWSEGRWSLRWRRVFWDVTVTRISESTYAGTSVWGPDFRSLQASDGTFPTQEFFQEVSQSDTLALYWAGKGLYNIASGGAYQYPLVPYQLDSAQRGLVNMPIDWPHGDYHRALVHEFFHVVEALAAISPTHGFAPFVRKSFPGWTGQGQFNYFRWQFASTLQNRWKEMNFLKRYPDSPDRERLDTNLEVVSSLSVEAREKADILGRQAHERHFSQDKSQAPALAQAALKLNPYHPQALRVAADSLHGAGKLAEAEALYERLLKVQPEAWIYNHTAYILQWQMKVPARAIAMHTQALAQYPDSSYAASHRMNLGQAYMQNQEYQEALKVWTRLIKEVPAADSHVPMAMIWMGYVWGDRLGDKKEGLRWVRKGLRAGYPPDDFALGLERAWK